MYAIQTFLHCNKFFLSMNEEIHDSPNIPLCISSQNDTSYYVELENNRRRFTVLEGKC